MYRIIGESEQICKIRELIRKVADSNAPVLIVGEIGTGRELVARSIHYNSADYKKPFTAIHCSAIPNNPIELLIGGTLFLAEIVELEPLLQAKLLRLLQEKEFEFREKKSKRVKFRLMSSARIDLRKEIKAGNFREDLFHLLNVIQIEVPPLRERRLDIPLLAANFLDEFCQREEKMLKISDEVMGIFMKYTWSGNVIELRKSIERAVVLAKDPIITPRELPDELLQFKETKVEKSNTDLYDFELPDGGINFETLANTLIRKAMIKANGNAAKAAKLLGMSYKTFWYRMEKLNKNPKP